MVIKSILVEQIAIIPVPWKWRAYPKRYIAWCDLCK